ncbi:hypothetical protein ABTI80_19065, partial [Acinetobacter baumannii]
TVYGTMSLTSPAASADRIATGAGRPDVGEPAGRIDEGGFTDAAVRAGLLVARLGRNQRRLSTFKRIRALVGRDVGLLAMPTEAAAQVVRRQAAFVE